MRKPEPAAADVGWGGPDGRVMPDRFQVAVDLDRRLRPIAPSPQLVVALYVPWFQAAAWGEVRPKGRHFLNQFVFKKRDTRYDTDEIVKIATSLHIAWEAQTMGSGSCSCS